MICSVSSNLHNGYEDKAQGREKKARRLLHEDWIMLVEEYSRRSLTQQSDKLIAFSGIAKKIANRFYKGDKEDS